MATSIRNVLEHVQDLADFVNALKKDRRVSGTATLSGGTIGVTGVTLTSFSRIMLSRGTLGGTAGHLSTASLNVGAGSFTINSSSGTDTSVIAYDIFNDFPHYDKHEAAALVTAATASDLPTSIALLNQLRAVCLLTWPDTLSHKAADATTFTAPVASDLASGIALANELKASHNTHIASTTFHVVADAVNNVSTTDATNLGTLETLVNALKTGVLAHINAGPTTPSIRVVAG